MTWVDKSSEKKLVAGLKKLLPGAGFITEEETIKNHRAKYTWIIDPLDGTTNFIHGVPCFCISIGLYETTEDGKGRMILGVIHDPSNQETFHAVKDKGAFLNGKRIRVTQRKNLKDSLLVTGFPTYDYSRMGEYLELFRYLMKHTRGLRRLGSAAIDLAWVACGRFDAFYEYSLNAWDVAAGALIVEEAGGEVSDFSGKDMWIFGKEIIASNGKLHRPLVKSVDRFF